MYICYVDESGHCGKKFNPEQPVEVLCGVRTDISKLFKTQRQHKKLLAILNKHNIKITELKASDAYGGRKGWNDVDPKIRDTVFEIMFEWFHERSCKFTVCPIDSGLFFEVKGKGDEFAQRFGYPYEAGSVNVVLSLQKDHRSKKNNKGKTFIVFDEQPGHDNNLLDLFESDLSFSDGYTGYKERPRAAEQPDRLDQLIDVPYFSKSHLTVLIQLADWAAFVVCRYLNLKVYKQSERYKGEFNKIEAWYKQINQCLITHTCIDPPGKDSLVVFFRDLRPPGWNAKSWFI